MNDATGSPHDEPLFGTLVMMLSTSALHHLGLGAGSGAEAPVDLRGAEAMIDLLEMLDRKTKTHRTAGESRMLAAALTEVRMAFVQATEAPPEAAAPEPETPAPDGDAPPGTPPSAPPGDGREPRYHKSYG